MQCQGCGKNAATVEVSEVVGAENISGNKKLVIGNKIVLCDKCLDERLKKGGGKNVS